MASCSMWKIVFNNVVLPEIYFSYDAAKAQLRRLEESNVASGGVIRPWDDDKNDFC